MTILKKDLETRPPRSGEGNISPYFVSTVRTPSQARDLSLAEAETKGQPSLEQE